MTPLSFDAQTAREIVGDNEARAIEQKARQDADKSEYAAPCVTGKTYWAQVQAQMRAIVYREQFMKRKARNERKIAQNAVTR